MYTSCPDSHPIELTGRMRHTEASLSQTASPTDHSLYDLSTMIGRNLVLVHVGVEKVHPYEMTQILQRLY
jgi:hypothetical protein